MPHPSASLASWTTSPPKVPTQASASELMTLKRLRSQETAQYPYPSTARRRAPGPLLRASGSDGAQVPQDLGVGGRGAHEE